MHGIPPQQLSDPGCGSPRAALLAHLAQLQGLLRTTTGWPWKPPCQWHFGPGLGRLRPLISTTQEVGTFFHSLDLFNSRPQNRDVADPIGIFPIMWHTLSDQYQGFGSVGPNQVGLCGVSHVKFKSLLNPLLRLVVNNNFISVFRDDRQPSSPPGPEASAPPLFVESGSAHEREKSHRPSVFWLAQRKAEWQTSFQSAWPMQGNGAIWPEKGFRLLLCAREGGWRKKADLNPPTMHSHLVIS